MAVVQAYNEGLGMEFPAGSRGRETRGQSPLKLKHFWFLDASWKSKFVHFSNIWKQKSRYFCYLCNESWVAMKLGSMEQNWEGLCTEPKTTTAGFSFFLVN